MALTKNHFDVVQNHFTLGTGGDINFLSIHCRLEKCLKFMKFLTTLKSTCSFINREQEEIVAILAEEVYEDILELLYRLKADVNFLDECIK